VKVGVVIPVGPGRAANLRACLAALDAQTIKPEAIVTVHDGPEAWGIAEAALSIPTMQVNVPKHEPGMEQPRNVGARAFSSTCMSIDHLWFVDSDVILASTALEELHRAHLALAYPRILVAPYDWMPPGATSPMPLLSNDPRWPSFRHYRPDVALTNDVGAGLACFSGNLVWPRGEFERVGGFWSELHHGRCEDGELGLRATAMDVPISFVARARGWHLWHPVDSAEVARRNARDVPLIHRRHPWVQQGAIIVSDRDGAAFDVDCSKCGRMIPTIEWWQHAEGEHEGAFPLPVLW